MFSKEFSYDFKKKIETGQVYIYVVVVVVIVAAAFGLGTSHVALKLDVTISIIIGILMYSMFSQLPFIGLKDMLSNRRFIVALCIVNYIAAPIVGLLLTLLLPDHPALLLGVYLVLLTPCIDYVIVFTAIGRGNEKAMLLATPFLLLSQMLLLPLYLWSSCRLFRKSFQHG